MNLEYNMFYRYYSSLISKQQSIHRDYSNNFEHNATVPTPPCNPTEPSDGTGELEPSDGTEIEPSPDRGRPVTVGEVRVSEKEEEAIERMSAGTCDAGV